MALIDKDALVARIKRLIRANELYLSKPETDEVRFQKTGAYSALNDLLHFLDTLEVKEVDFDKELSYEDYKSFFEKYPNLSDDWGFDEAWAFAKYFYELGLKAQKGE